ncbi:MAG: BamA/TamA family outer membrane protein [Candidatus Kapabacteria bacterium]|nr:BamA/TamA family outer membrane protein [Candidatus Kapabacteria bacterium]
MGVLTAFLTNRTEADPSFRASSMAVGIQATQNAQFAFGVYPEIYLDSNRMRIEGLAEWYLYPYKFFGIGNGNPSSNAELYTPYGFKVQARVLRAVSGDRVQQGLSIGVRIDIRYDHMKRIDTREDGSVGPLGAGLVAGYNGGWFNGIGPLVSYDTRDNNFDARAGLYCEAATIVYGKGLGSTYSSTLIQADLRAYASIANDLSLAGRLMVQNTSGTPTFQQWPSIGGTSNLRGVIDAQQRDRISALMSAEFRFPIIWRFRGVVFTDIGQVGGAPSSFTLPQTWASWGGGIRFLLVPQERISLRFDVGVARGVVQYYLSFNEAF